MFSRTTIDLGVVVSDLDKAAKFYTDVVGFTEVPGFTVDAKFCKTAGLTDNKALNIRVFKLGEDETATRLKLMELPETKPQKQGNDHIHSTLGFSYLTIFVSDLDAALERCEKAGVKPVTEGDAVPLPGGGPGSLTLVRDPDGNFIELIGPKK